MGQAQMTGADTWLGTGALRPLPAYAIALAATAATLGLRLALDDPLDGRPTLVMFTMPIMLSAYLGGWGAGVFSTLLTYLLTSYYLLPPILSFAIESTANRWQQFFIVLAGLVISGLNEALHRARRRAHNAVREQEQVGAALRLAEDRHTKRLYGIVDTAMDAIVSIDGMQRVVLFNAAAEKMFGCKASSALGEGLQRFMPGALHAQHAVHVEAFGRTGVTARSMKSLGTLMARRADGSEFPIEASISHIDVDGQKFYTAILRDITDRQQSSARLLAQLERLSLLDQLTRAIGERQDLQSIFQVTAQSVEAQLPMDFACVLNWDAATHTLKVGGIGQDSAALIPDLVSLDSIAFDAQRLKRILSGELIHDVDTSQVDAPFARRMAEAGLNSLVLAPLRSEERAYGILVAARRAPQSISSSDCEFLRQLSAHVALAAHQAHLYSELHAAFEELRVSQQAVTQQERLRAIGQMASGIAHDINNALTPAVLYVERVLEAEALSAPGRKQVESISRAIDDVVATVARMREFYRARERQETLLPLQPNELIRQVIEMSRARWSDIPQRRGVEIVIATELAESLPMVAGSESEIREALINLVFNSVDAMPEGGTLTFKTYFLAGEEHLSAERAGQGHVALEVSDTGVGMDEATRRRCLEPFFTTKGDRGTGLGLAMVYGTAKRHDASIVIDSSPGSGTSIRMLLPVRSWTGSTSNEVAAEVPSKMHLLLVDDDALLLKALASTLQGDGHRIQVAHGGQAGIDAFVAATAAGASFDVVITDLGMPQVDGRLVAAAVKKHSPGTPVILLTGWGQRMTEEGEAPADVDVVLSKPPRLADLRAGLARVMPRVRD